MNKLFADFEAFCKKIGGEVGRKAKNVLATILTTIVFGALLFYTAEISDATVKLGAIAGEMGLWMIALCVLVNRELIDRSTTYAIIVVGAGALITAVVLNWGVINISLSILTLATGILCVLMSIDGLKEELSQPQPNCV